jgi:hypothetical protein
MSVYVHKEKGDKVRLLGHDNEVTFVGEDGERKQTLPSGEFFANYREADEDERGNPETAGLRVATDDDLREILANEFPADQYTADGKIKVDAINERLQSRGFLPIPAAKRDELLTHA